MVERQRVALVCDECGARNYKTTKARKVADGGTVKRLALKKFCPTCNRHTMHRESK